MSASSGWGFCQKSCFPSPEEELGGVERYKNVEVVGTAFCRRRLTEAGAGFAVEPKVLCVAFNHTYHTQW